MTIFDGLFKRAIKSAETNEERRLQGKLNRRLAEKPARLEREATERRRMGIIAFTEAADMDNSNGNSEGGRS